MQNLGQFLREYSQLHRDRIAYEIKRGFRTERFTFAEVESLALKTATFLKQKGLGKGDKVAIWAANMPEYPILYFGCWVLGIIVVPIDVRTTEETLKVFLTKARCRIGFKGRFVPGYFRKLVKESFYLENLVDLVKDLPLVNNSSLITHNDLAEIAFTSGTTGTPKGVMLTHGNFLSDVQALTAAFPFKKDYRTLSLLPLSHAFEQVVDFLALFKSGIKVTYLERTNRLTIIRAMRKGKITSVVLVPQALQLLLGGIEAEVEKQGKQRIWSFLNQIAPMLPIWARRLLFRQVQQKFGGSLQFFGTGSAPLNLKLAQKWENLGVEIFEGYGATEATAALTINTTSSKRLGSVGKVLPGMKVKVNPDVSSYTTPGVIYVHTPGVPGVVGEILARGSNISPGYFEDEEKTKAAFFDGWYRTGDVGEFDRDGFLYITGREAFRIVLPNGQKVYPEDIEKKLNAHRLVVESCAVGVTREEGERVHASIITKHPDKLAEIIKDVNSKLASHEQIMEWSLWEAEDFPRTPILKIDRRKVLEKVLGVEAKEKGVETTTADRLLNIISQIAKMPATKIKATSILASELRLDSLSRVELVSRIEEELGVAIDEVRIGPQTKVSDIRKFIEEAPVSSEEIPLHKMIYSRPFSIVRLLLQDFLAFPLFNLFVPLEVKGRENLTKLKGPVIFYFNHIGIFDGGQVLRALPKSVRKQVVIPVWSEVWNDYRWPFVELFAAGFPFDNEKRVKASLELVGDFLDQGFSILVAPEGNFSADGTLQELKGGTGFMAVSMQVQIVPIKIDPSYRKIFPPMDRKFIENLPKKRKRITIRIGKPLRFVKGTPYEEATRQMQQALENL